MKKNLSLILLLLLFQQIFSQIKSNSGTDMPGEYYFCPGESHRFSVDDYALSGGGSIAYDDVSLYITLLSTTVGEVDVPFSALTRDNVFSHPINLGFSFQFFGKNYTKLVVGTNGRLVFTNDAVLDNLNDSANYADTTFSNPAIPIYNETYNKVYKNPPLERKIPLAQIFAGFTKLRSNTGITFYKYKPVVSAGVKGMVFTFQNVVPHNGAGEDYGGIYTSKVLIFEDGRVIINVSGKLNATYNAILGMQNETATESLIPDHKYNNGYWTSESSTAFVFKTDITRTPTYNWKLNGTTVSNTRFFPDSENFTPNDGDKLEVNVNFAEAGVTPVHDEVVFKKVKTPVIQKSVLGCDVLLKIDSETFDSELIYKWYRNGSATEIQTGGDLLLNNASPADSYYLKVFKPDETTCSDAFSKSNLIAFNNLYPPTAKKTAYYFCDNSAIPGSKKTGINLYTEFYDKYVPSSAYEDYSIEFSDSNGIIITPENYTAYANQPVTVTLKVRISGSATDCYTETLTLNFISVKNSERISVCESLRNFNLKNYFENNFPSTGYNYTYTYSDGTPAGDGTSVDVTKPVLIKTLLSGSSCSATTSVIFNIGTAISVPVVPVQERCAGSSSVMANWFDLAAIRNILDPSNQYDVKFYRKSDSGELSVNNRDGSQLNGTNFWSGKMGDYIIYARLYNKADPSCFGTSNDIVLRVYPKPRVKTNPITLNNCPGNTFFNLTQNPADLSDAPATMQPKIEYFSETNQLLSNEEIASYDASILGIKPYIKITYNAACGDTVSFDLRYYQKPLSKISQITVCEQKVYSGDMFKNQTIDNASQYSFFEKDGITPLPPSFNLASLPLNIEFFIKNNSTGCTSDLQRVTFAKGGNSILLKSETDYKLCDETSDTFDGKTVFNLDSKKSDFTTVPGTIFKYYKDADYTQEITNPGSYTNETAFNQTIFVKITVPGYCPADAKINLIVNTATKSTTLLDKYFICYGGTVLADAGSENSSFSWSNGGNTQIKTFTRSGTYSVTLTNSSGCRYTHQFVISDENQPKIQKINQTEQQIEVIAAGKHNIEYSFDGGITWQTSNILLNPTADQYDIQVRSVLSDGVYCLGEFKSIFTIKISNVITPNGDGYNDFWTVKNLDKMDEVEIIISDRYGKAVFHSTDKNNLIWDGKYNGRVLPTASYWYVVKWFDPSRQKNEIRQGWVLLKNRS